MSNDIVRAIEEAGVAGAGGAGFPTHVKAAARAETIIANYAECEPIVASDTAIVTTQPELLMRGLRLMQEATGSGKAVVAVKAKRREQVEILSRMLGKENGFSLHLLEDVLNTLKPLQDHVSFGPAMVADQTLVRFDDHTLSPF